MGIPGGWAPNGIFWRRQKGLLQVLKAYTLYRPEQGYCQAQGPVAAVLLMHLPPEVSALNPAPGIHEPQPRGSDFRHLRPLTPNPSDLVILSPQPMTPKPHELQPQGPGILDSQILS